MTVYEYRTRFNLDAPVQDFNAAQNYLQEDNMEKYFHMDSRITGNLRLAVDKIKWNLVDDDAGYIEVIANRELTDDEKKSVSDWIRGQNSDGLGEGFEQQDFACYPDPDLDYGSDEYYDEDWLTASFDWKHNKYELELYCKDE